MKYTLMLCLCLPLGLFAQSGLVGTWTTQVPDREGNMVPLDATMAADGTYAIDFMADGKIDITGTYRIDGNQVTVQDDEGNECTAKGIYTFTIVDKTLTMTKVEDACEGRSGPEGKMVMVRK